jgi:hypothetical protein
VLAVACQHFSVDLEMKCIYDPACGAVGASPHPIWFGTDFGVGTEFNDLENGFLCSVGSDFVDINDIK